MFRLSCSGPGLRPPANPCTRARGLAGRFIWQDLTPDHVRALAPSPRFAHFASLRAAFPDLAEQVCDGPARAGLRLGVVLVVGGVVPAGPDRGFAWMAAGAIGPRDYPEITAVARSLFDEAARRGLTRIEAQVNASWPAAQRWIGRLGFGFARDYRPAGLAETFQLWAREAPVPGPPSGRRPTPAAGPVGAIP